MSEIEKLYRNAGINMCTLEFRTQYTTCDYNTCNGRHGKTSCGWYVVPPLTPEKQLELVKWLMRYDELHADFNDNEYGLATLNYSGNYKKEFANALASVINREIWQDLTESERNEIQDILKGKTK